jgi:hypothetical protein
MVHAPDRKRFALETLVDLVDPLDLGMQKLHREGTLDRNVLRKVDAPHPTRAEHSGDPVPSVENVTDARCRILLR